MYLVKKYKDLINSQNNDYVKLLLLLRIQLNKPNYFHSLYDELNGGKTFGSLKFSEYYSTYDKVLKESKMPPHIKASWYLLFGKVNWTVDPQDKTLFDDIASSFSFLYATPGQETKKMTCLELLIKIIQGGDPKNYAIHSLNYIGEHTKNREKIPFKYSTDIFLLWYQCSDNSVMLTDEKGTVLDVAIDDVSSKYHAWTNYYLYLLNQGRLSSDQALPMLGLMARKYENDKEYFLYSIKCRLIGLEPFFKSINLSQGTLDIRKLKRPMETYIQLLRELQLDYWSFGLNDIGYKINGLFSRLNIIEELST